MSASRHLPVACLLVGLALIPTIIHSYGDDPGGDGRTTGAIATELAGYTAHASNRNPTWGQRRFDSKDWMEREYRGIDGRTVVLTVVRSHDAKRLYHHPELAVAYGVSFVGHETVRLAHRPDLPLHVLKPGAGVAATSAYALHYDGRFVENPLLFQIRIAGELLFKRRQPMTLFFVLDRQAAPGEDIATAPSTAVLLHAVDAFLGQTAAAR